MLISHQISTLHRVHCPQISSFVFFHIIVRKCFKFDVHVFIHLANTFFKVLADSCGSSMLLHGCIHNFYKITRPT